MREGKEEAQMKGEDMIRSIIPKLPVGEEDNMFVSTTSSRHMGMTDTLLEIEVTEIECTIMISGLESRMSTLLILMVDIPMIGWARPNTSSMSTMCQGRQRSELLAFTWRAQQGGGGGDSNLSLSMKAGDSGGQRLSMHFWSNRGLHMWRVLSDR